MAELYNGLTVGSKVRIVDTPSYKGKPTTSRGLAIGTEGYVTKLSDGPEEAWRFNANERKTHVVFNTTNRPGGGTWVNADSLELIEPEVGNQEIEDALKSITEAARHQEHVLMFKSIIVTDANGKEITVSVNGERVTFTDVYEETLLEIDLDTWINLQEVVDLSFRQINPMHKGRER